MTPFVIPANHDASMAKNSARTRLGEGLKLPCPFPTVTAAFYHHVRTHPDVLAARDLSGDTPREITYDQLALHASHLAARLRSHGVGPGVRVPLVVKRSVEMLVGMIAVLLCGAQYVPLDGSIVPDSTISFVFEQTRSPVALCVASIAHRILARGTAVKVLVIEECSRSIETQLPWADLARPDLGCYVIYTSGTTGTPKGVDVTHRNVTNLVCLSPGNLGIRTQTKVGQVLNISFDMAAWEILGCLCNGGTLILRGSDWKPALLEVEVLICTPSILSKYDPRCYPSIKTVATAGEPSFQRKVILYPKRTSSVSNVIFSLADLWASHATYYNCCGPTETTIVNTMQKHVPGQPLSIGWPTPNNIVYILDADEGPVPCGVSGVMWAGGCGVSRGYVGLPEKTAERYKLDKFSNDGSYMYNTGDLCRWNPDGTIHILGRTDDQIKIKGFRVELDGVSASLSSAPGVSRAVALLIDGQIHGYLAPSSCDTSAIQKHLKTCQPYYAIPSQLHVLEELPITGNGKIDKRELKNLAGSASKCLLQPPPPASNSSCTTLSEKSEETAKALSPSSAASTMTIIDERPDLTADIPDKNWPKPFRGLRWTVFIVYRVLFSLVSVANLSILITISALGFSAERFSTIMAANLVLAVLIRQDFVINALYTLSCSIPKSFPLYIRVRCGKIYHLGGVHSGAALCAAVWLLASNIAGTVCQVSSCENWPKQSLASRVLSWMLSGLFLVMMGSAWPPFRKKHHDLFERLHRFVGWTMLGLFWVQILLSINDSKYPNQSLGRAILSTPSFWLLTAATCSIATSWVFLRKVPVDAEVLSDHAIRLHFDYTVPVNGTFARLSRRPLLEWHSFATIPAPVSVSSRPKGYSLVVSNAGDWTKTCIKNPPTKLWIRGVPTCGVMRIATLFNRVVVIATGSGIGPLLGHIQQPTCPTQLIWSSSSPEKSFGMEILNMIKEKIPDAVIHDTKAMGRPDLVMMGYNLAKSFQAEAVIVIANQKITKKIVYGLETRGVPAYGAIWDS